MFRISFFDGESMFHKIRHRFIFAAALYLLALSACARMSATDKFTKSVSNTAAVKRGIFRRTVRLTGAVGAVESFAVLAPRLSGQMMGSGVMILTKIVRNGTTVRKGDVLVEFDRQTQQKNIMDRQAEYDGFLQQLRKKQADQTSTKIADETEIRGAEVDVKSALVELRKNELVPKYQAEINKANLAEAEAQLKQLKETYNLKRQAEVADLRILEIQRDRALIALEYAKSNVDRMTVLSTMDGIVVLIPIYKGTRRVDPQEGDEVRPGAAIMQVVNPSAMKVSARVNQVDIAELHIGQFAEIRLDAYPDLAFPGKVGKISFISSSDSDSKQIKYFSAMIMIQGKNPKLLPDLTAAVDIHLQTLDNALIIPRAAVINRMGQSTVEIVSNGKSERRTVKLGPMNDCESVVESGLQEGMAVSLNPEE
jgi:HlyD family secretion protein